MNSSRLESLKGKAFSLVVGILDVIEQGLKDNSIRSWDRSK